MEGNKKILIYSVTIITGIFFLVWGLLEARSVLAPLITAIILALFILPVAKWMEKFFNRAADSIGRGSNRLPGNQVQHATDPIFLSAGINHF